MKNIIMVSVLIYFVPDTGILDSAQNRYLFIDKSNANTGLFPKTYHLPGGGLFPDETPLQGAKRFISEEAGIDLKDIAGLSSYDFYEHTQSVAGEKTLFCFLRYLAKAKSEVQGKEGGFWSSVLIVNKEGGFGASVSIDNKGGHCESKNGDVKINEPTVDLLKKLQCCQCFSRRLNEAHS